MPSPRVIGDMLRLPFWIEGDRLYRFDKGKRGIRDAGWTPAPEALASYRRASPEEQALWAALLRGHNSWDVVRTAAAQWPPKTGRALHAVEVAHCVATQLEHGWARGGESHLCRWPKNPDADALLLCDGDGLWFSDPHWALPRGDGNVYAEDDHVACERCLRVLEKQVAAAAAIEAPAAEQTVSP